MNIKYYIGLFRVAKLIDCDLLYFLDVSVSI